MALGSAILLLTIFAGQAYYQMFVPAVALTIMFLSTAFVALQSVKNNSLSLSLSGLVLAVLAPLFSGDLGGPYMTFNYLLVVTLGAIWIVAIKKNWGAIILANLVAVFFYSLPIISSYSDRTNNSGLINYAYIFTLIFFLNSLVNIWRSREGNLKAFLWTAVINSIFVLTWIMSFAAPEWQSLIVALWMVIFAIGAFVLFAEVKIPTVFYVYSGVAVMFLAVATALELNGSALTLAYIIEGALIPIIIRLITKDLRVMIKTSLILIAPAILAAGNLLEYFDSREVMNKEFFVVLFMVAALMIVGSIIGNYRKIESIDTEADSFLLIVGSVFAYGLIWAFISNLLSADPAVATAISLIIFTVIGLVKYFYGIIVSSKILKTYGAILLGLVVARLILVDVWSMTMGAKIFVFIMIGVLLISTAFISRRIKQA